VRKRYDTAALDIVDARYAGLEGYLYCDQKELTLRNSCDPGTLDIIDAGRAKSMKQRCGHFEKGIVFMCSDIRCC
jgi:hypothetical protein